MTRRGSPPKRSIAYTWLSPSRFERNASTEPSGLKRGRVSDFTLLVMRRAGPPPSGVIQTSALRVNDASISVTT